MPLPPLPVQPVTVAYLGPNTVLPIASVLAAAIGRDIKGKLSPVLYGVAIAAAFYKPWVSAGLYVLVAFMWLVPDRRIERVVEH